MENKSILELIREEEGVKKQAEKATVNALSTLIVFFLRPAILMWMMPTLTTLLPVLAPLCALGYWQWMGMYLIICWACTGLGKILHR